MKIDSTKINSTSVAWSLGSALVFCLGIILLINGTHVRFIVLGGTLMVIGKLLFCTYILQKWIDK